MWTLGSGFAEYVTAPAAYCRPLGPVPADLGLLEPIACATTRSSWPTYAWATMW